MQMLGRYWGSGIKGCLVDTETGELIGERHRIATPGRNRQPRPPWHTPQALVGTQFHGRVPWGAVFPATIHNGIAKNASTSTRAGLRPMPPTCLPMA